MIPLNPRGVGYYPSDEEYSNSQKRIYGEYVAERRKLPTEELQRTIYNYDRESFVGNLIRKLVSDADFLIRIKATRQVLEERAEQAQY